MSRSCRYDVVADDLLGVVDVVDSLLLVLFVVISLFPQQTHSYRDGCECIPVVNSLQVKKMSKRRIAYTRASNWN